MMDNEHFVDTYFKNGGKEEFAAIFKALVAENKAVIADNRAAITAIVTEHKNGQAAIMTELALNRDVLNRNDKRLALIEEEIKALRAGFPDDNPQKHCEYHEGIIEKGRMLAKRKEEIITHLSKGVVWGFLIALGYGMLLYIKQLLGIK